MLYKTFSELVGDVVTEAGLVEGSAVQTYTDPQVKAAIQTMFNMFLMKRAWPGITEWRTWTLDGTTGLVTDTTTDILSFEDIHKFYRGNTNLEINEPRNREHLYATGSYPLYRTRLVWNDANQAKLVKFWPVTATGTVDVQVTVRPADFVDDADVVPFEPTVMKLGALWYMLAADGLNNGAADKAKVLFDTAFSDYTSKIDTKDIGYGNAYDYDPLVLP